MNIKRIYFDLRMGQSLVFPVISMINFIIISYSLTTVSTILPMQFYIPIVVLLLVFALIGVGNLFRHRQQSTDFTLIYENNIELVKTLNAMLSDNPKLIAERIKYHNKIIKRHES